MFTIITIIYLYIAGLFFDIKIKICSLFILILIDLYLLDLTPQDLLNDDAIISTFIRLKLSGLNYKDAFMCAKYITREGIVKDDLYKFIETNTIKNVMMNKNYAGIDEIKYNNVVDYLKKNFGEDN
jgi:hypothetical protein